MCGLFLALERHQPVNAARARQALAALRHRGPDGIGEYSWSSGPATGLSGFVGHTRLSILDTSSRSAQPFRRGARTLAYNGEIYNFRALRQQLAGKGHVFETDGDTEVLMALLAEGGPQALNQANGMWAFCLLDEARKQLTAARDRYGKKPLFYYADAHRICLASEIRPILVYLDRPAEMRGADVDSYLRDGWLYPDASGATHIQGIRQVVAGGVLNVDLATWQLSAQSYHTLEDYGQSHPPAPEALGAQLQDAVLSRLVADRKVGLLLSGGVDSSLILSILAAQGLTDQVTCFTGDAGKSDDATYARQCITQLGIQAVNIPLDYGSSGMDAFLQVCRHQEKPFPFIGNVLAMPQLYARIAEHDVPVVLDGTGGDELFAGYWDRYYRFAVRQALAEGDRAWLADSLAANADRPQVLSIAHQVLQEATALPGAPPMAPSGLVRATEDPADLDTFVVPEVLQARRVDPLPVFHGTLAQALVTDAEHGRLQEWLWQNDRNAMTYGIENRSPLLDFRLAGFLHSDYRGKFVGAWNKHELRTAFSQFVPLPTQWRRDKQGFRWVYHRFLQSNRSQALELVDSSRLLPQRVDVKRLLDAARKRDDYLECGLLQRMLCLAGLEQTMGLA
jgi:asparagine synthase (glutamine-hydrolysing)